MKRLILFLFVMAAVNLNAAQSMVIEFIGSQGQRLTVNATDTLPTSANVSVSSITVSAFPVYANESGTVATGQIDANNRVKVNISSATINVPIVGTVTANIATGTNEIGRVIPTVGVSTSSPILTDEYGNTTASTTLITLSATPVAVTTLANRRELSLVASGIFQCYIGTTTTPVASATDIYDMALSCGPETPILVGTNATATILTVYQQGRP